MPKIFAVSDKKLRQKTLAGKNGAQVFFCVRKMSIEEEKKPEKSAREKKRIVPAALGFLAVAAVVIAALRGYGDPLFGAAALALGVVIAVVAFLLGLIFRSHVARRLGIVAVVAALIVAAAGTLALFSDKTFEDRCVAAWEKITRASDDAERRIEELENRFDVD